jgi:hypothetical protein
LPTGPIDDELGPLIPDFSDSTGGTPTPTSATSTTARTAVAVAGGARRTGGRHRRARLIRSIRRRTAAQSVDRQLADAWQRATSAVGAVGVPLRPSDTPLDVAASTARHFPLVTRPMTSLADVVTEATYRPEGTAGYDAVGAYGKSTVNDCRNWAKQIDRAVTESLDWPRPAPALLHPWR